MNTAEFYRAGYGIPLYDIRADKQVIRYLDKDIDIPREMYLAHLLKIGGVPVFPARELGL